MRRCCLLVSLLLCTSGLFAKTPKDAHAAALSLQQRVIEVFNGQSPAIARVGGHIPATEETPEQYLLSTGFFISKEGLLLSVSRIPAEADRIWVEYRGVAYEAHVIGFDPITNLALLKTLQTPHGLQHLPLSAGEERLPEIGSFALEISCKFGQDPAPGLTMISAKDAFVRGHFRFPTTYLRCDLQGAGGEEGAPVFDLDGDLIGVVVASSPSLFVLPLRQTIKVRDDLLFSGKVEYGFLGLELKPYATNHGETVLVVESLLENGPAAEGGLEIGDLVRRFEGKPISQVSQFQDLFFFARPGKRVRFDIERNGEAKTLNIEVGNATDQTILAEEAGPPAQA